MVFYNLTCLHKYIGNGYEYTDADQMEVLHLVFAKMSLIKYYLY